MGRINSMKWRSILLFSVLIWSHGWLVGKDEIQFRLAAVEDQIPAGNLFEIVLQARIKEGWHLYSLTQPPGGPIPTSISVGENPVFRQAGSVEQPLVKTWFDENFRIETEYFEKEVEFYIPVKSGSDRSSGLYTLPIRVKFQVCSDQLCLPPQTKILETPIQVISSEPASPEGKEEGYHSSGSQNERPSFLPDQKGSDRPQRSWIQSIPEEDSTSGRTGLALATLAYVLGAMGMGGIALLTPCVFPMIPITVSYFTKREAVTKRRAVTEAGVYSLGIILTFTVIAFLLTFLLGAGGINRLASSPLVNIAIASIFVVFALSLFGVLEMRLPASWISAVDRKGSTSGGVVGIMAMALTFSLTSFTCTVPFVGAVMVAASQGDWWWSLLGVSAFAAVFSAPFFLLAVFPTWLQSLPKSGNWMNSVKITMGFLELAAAVKFLSNVDLVYQWEILTRPVFIAVWLGISLLTTLYLLGRFHFPHEVPSRAIGTVRVLFSIIFLAMSLYLVRGFFGASLGELDAFLPPRDYGNPALVALPGGFQVQGRERNWLSNYSAALATAREENRPIFIDFTGYTCTNCRWMEANVFTLHEVQQLFEKYVLVRLYTDGNRPEHADNLRFEQERFGTIALPLYVIVSARDEIVAIFPGLTRNERKFIDFLEQGLVRAQTLQLAADTKRLLEH